VVWDPFVGSGLELIERGLLGAYRAMYGTDVDDAALAAAKTNIAAARVKHVTLLNRDAASAPVHDITLVLTNPPMGARLVRDGSLGDLLEAVLVHGYHMMRPGARWVWHPGGRAPRGRNPRQSAEGSCVSGTRSTSNTCATRSTRLELGR
jgi:tRNA G10  N-methylase Trm11